jgi:hypothetical protein
VQAPRISMTDLEQFKAMLDRAKVPYETGNNVDHMVVIKISAEWADTPQVRGWTGFFTQFTFDNSGNLEYVGIWE